MSTQPMLADGSVRQLDPRSIEFNRAAGWIVAGSLSLPLLLALLVTLLVTALPPWVGAVCALAWLGFAGWLVWLAQIWPARAYEAASYVLDEKGIEIRRGVYWRAIITVPRSRVQHIDVRQGPMRRSYGLGVLVIYTAGTEHSSVRLSGLDHDTALALRDLLLPETHDDGV